jgi:methylated-DNA-[protein]-cysteine S-methyltransferase
MRDRSPHRLILARLDTPIGEALLVSDDRGRLRALDWQDHEARLRRFLRLHYGRAASVEGGRAPRTIAHALEAYFAGEFARLNAIECGTAGTPFQRAVWAALREIPAGRTMSYGALAACLGRADAVRAVGHANGANPISIVVPCHRVIGADGGLTGYGGGLARKRWLLDHEGAPLGAATKQGTAPVGVTVSLGLTDSIPSRGRRRLASGFVARSRTG